MPLQTKLTDLRPAREKYSRTITLLSGGAACPGAFPEGKLTVFPWDSKVDEWFATRLRRGAGRGRTIFFYLLDQLCDLNGCPRDKFIASEVMTVLMVARSILYQDAVEYSAECPECGAVERTQLKIPDELEKIGEKAPDWPGFDTITLAKSGDVVRVKLLTVGEELAILERSEEQRRRCSDSVATVAAGIVAVNDGKPDSAAEVLTWLNALPPADFEQLSVQFDKLQPQLSTAVHHQCGSCGAAFDYSLRLDVDFFRREGLSGDRKQVETDVRTGVLQPGVDRRSNSDAGLGAAKDAQVARGANRKVSTAT